MDLTTKITILFSGSFFLVGLLTGVWKYIAIARSEDSVAPAYVDIAHRASLMYSFACLVVLEFVALSPYPDTLTALFAIAPQVFFAAAICTYVIHGCLNDTDNQLHPPYRLGSRSLSGSLVHGFMVLLVVAELGGFAALFVGGVYTLVFA
ncbi:MAG: hypothetical protein R3E66_17635 [bacterium]